MTFSLQFVDNALFYKKSSFKPLLHHYDLVFFIFDKLKMLAIKKSITSDSECPITMQEVKELEGTVRFGVSDEDVARLLEFKEQYS